MEIFWYQESPSNQISKEQTITSDELSPIIYRGGVFKVPIVGVYKYSIVGVYKVLRPWISELNFS